MKTKYFSMLFIAAIISNSSFSQDVKTETLKVWGNCGMCEQTIEKAAKQAGASVAEWNEETKLLTVSYNEKKSNSLKIQQAIANAGYDTQDLKASDKAYNKLHGCCKYDRKTDEESKVTESKDGAAKSGGDK